MKPESLPEINIDIPISLVRQHVFCPRIPYFLLMLDREWVKPLWVNQGQTYQNKRELLLKKRILTGFPEKSSVSFHVFVSSKTWGIHGILDSLIDTEDEIIPIEIKMNANKPQRGHLLQLTGYSICLLEAKKEVRRFLILTGKHLKRHEFALTEKLKEDFFKELAAIRRNLKRPFPPYSSAPVSKCSQCEYQIQCQDRDF